MTILGELCDDDTGVIKGDPRKGASISSKLLQNNMLSNGVSHGILG